MYTNSQTNFNKEKKMVSPTLPGSIQRCEICQNIAGTRIGCAPRFCGKCSSEYMQAELKQGVVTLNCSSDGCEKLLEPDICKTIIWSTVYNKWCLAPRSRNFEAELPASIGHVIISQYFSLFSDGVYKLSKIDYRPKRSVWNLSEEQRYED